MDTLNNEVSLKRRIARILILLYSLVIIGVMFVVLIFMYEPNQNSVGALGSACMDVVTILTLTILVMSLSYEKGVMSRATKLFLALMLGTMWGLFFDFLTWSLDGSLKYGNWTFAFTIASLCTGAILATFFVSYLSNYLDDMYGITSFYKRAKICVVLNCAAFILTLTLALTKQAFVFVDGHYTLGPLYDVITVIPLLTLLYMSIFSAVHIKQIGIHDVMAVFGYIVTMIIGVVIEAIYGIGTSYVSISLADVIIFVMLQNRLIDRARKQKEELAEKISSQYEILESMAGIYSYVYCIDFTEMTAKRFDISDSVIEQLKLDQNPHTKLNQKLYKGIDEDQQVQFWHFTNLATLPDRMATERIITNEFLHNTDGWFRAQYIRIGDDMDAPPKRVIYTIRNIDEEKRNVEKWIRKSNTDEVTGFYNRHAYEEEIVSIEKNGIAENFTYFSMDVNGLKVVNDTLGHEAGDELIIGACSCMKQCFGKYGKLFRTGGDEFVALLYVNDADLNRIKKEFTELVNNWHGKLIDHMTISSGCVTWEESLNMNIHQVAVLADKRMYDSKTKYYQRKGFDRRGQKDAHVALCALYSKILKINVTEDAYQIVNVKEEEQKKDRGFSESISAWLHDFGTSGMVHPDDLEDYLIKTDIEYIRNYFRNGNTSLRIFYRRQVMDGFQKVMMEIIPANNYRDDAQNLFLYVKNIEEL